MKKLSFSSVSGIFILCFVFFVTIINSGELKAQVPVITKIGNYTACPGDVVIVPIRVWNFDSIGSVSLTLQYNDTVLTYQGYQNLNPSLGTLLIHPISNAIYFANYSISCINIPDSGVIVELKFLYNGGGCGGIIWDTTFTASCSYSNCQANTLPGIFYNGTICGAGPEIISQPASTISVYAMEDTTISITATGTSTLTYQWQYSTDGGTTWHNCLNSAPYGNINTPDLILTGTPLSLNGNLYHCVVSGTCPSDTSGVTTLYVQPASVIQGTLTYDNAYSTPLINTIIELYDNSGIISTTTTDSAGNYSITGISAGQYTVKAVVTKPYGGVNATDALLVLNHFINTGNLQGLKLIAGDVNSSGYINSVDALFIAKRFTGMITSFPSGDWYSENKTIQANGIQVYTINLKAICYGDVNGSHIP